jgi:RNA polymerase sigma-70 factor (ECF subfamily)
MNPDRTLIVFSVLAIALPLAIALAQDKSDIHPTVVEDVKLTNAGFELGDFLPAGWKQGATIPGVEYSWDKNVAHSGKASVRIEKTAKKYFPIAAWTHVMPHEGPTRKLEVRAWVKADQAHKAILDVGFTDSNEKESHQWAAYIGVKKTGDDPAKHDWTEYRGVVAIPEGTQTLAIGLQVYGPGTVWFDDISAAYVVDETPASLYEKDGQPRPAE